MTGLHLTSCETADIAEAAGHRIAGAPELVAELVAALRMARSFIEADRDRQFEDATVCGDPATLDPEDAHAIAFMDAMLTCIDAVLARAAGGTQP